MPRNRRKRLERVSSRREEGPSKGRYLADD
jgi:hypothetical protein